MTSKTDIAMKLLRALQAHIRPTLVGETTPIPSAANVDKSELLEHQGDVIRLAIYDNDADAVRFLLELGADPNAASVTVADGVSISVTNKAPIHIAVEMGSIVITELLLNAGADVNAVFKYVDGLGTIEGTALGIAERNKRMDCAAILQRCGGQPYYRDDTE